MGIRLAMVGLGAFAQDFLPLYSVHPMVDALYLCDLEPNKRDAAAAKYPNAGTFSSLDDVCASPDIDAVVIITQHWLHGPQAIQALRAGKHVYSAVPAAITVENMLELVRAVDDTGRIYMMGETSYYAPTTVYCRQRFEAGDFGHVVYVEGDYLHDWDHGLYEVYEWRYGADWRRRAGDPPMHYPTHSVAFPVGVTGAHVTHVSCHGFHDRKAADADIYGGNQWGNPFSNETALMTLSNGGCCRINEFRRIGHPGGTRMSVLGTEASFEQNAAGMRWLTKDHRETLNLDAMLTCKPTPYDGYSAAHDRLRLPKEFEGLHNGHEGSHQFLVDDFVKACASGVQPPINVRMAAKMVLPGLIAHESAMGGGELLEVPVVD